ncbi:hypothetical protein [Streptacidiphilus monticola]|uniref:Uncharacterized protein n=1 Tax=Streptacidiphilus monticola TaxID=2161674 RepID=A0ABW1G250_9ACTN
MTQSPTLPPEQLRWWSVYLNNHLSGAVAGAQLAQRLADGLSGEPLQGEARRLAREIAQDRDSLRGLMERLGVARRPLYACLGWAVERGGRLKPNGRLLRRSPLTSLVECEAMRTGVEAKRQMWRALDAARLPEPDGTTVRELEERAAAQAAALENVHRHLAEALGRHPDQVGLAHAGRA